MNNIYYPPTQISSEYRVLAQKIVDLFPLNLASEIALTGSVARGVADCDSDIELNCWASNIPTARERRKWLENIGATEIIFDSEPICDGSFWLTCLFQDTWIEIGWQTEKAQDQLLKSILQGSILDSGRLIVAGLISQAIILRSKGLLPKWREELTNYPKNLSEKLILDLIEPWQFPHLIKTRWALVRRKQRFALVQRLTQDITNLLRILFAINNKWETDVKWLDSIVAELTIKPNRLLERIDEIFSCLSLNEKVLATLDLITETLRLLPPLPEVKRAITNLEKNLSKG